MTGLYLKCYYRLLYDWNQKSVSELEGIKPNLVYHLIRRRCFEDARYKKKWLVVVEGTQFYSGQRKLNAHCLGRCCNKGTDEVIILYHRDGKAVKDFNTLATENNVQPNLL